MGDDSLEAWAPAVYRFALRLTRDRHAAEDLTQETFLRAFRSAGGLRAPGAAKAWLLRIAVNAWRDLARRRKIAAPQALTEDPPGPATCPRAERREDAERALAALDALPGRQREVLYLHAVEGMELAEVAGVLGITSGAAKASLSLARQAMRSALADVVADLCPRAGTRRG